MGSGSTTCKRGCQRPNCETIIPSCVRRSGNVGRNLTNRILPEYHGDLWQILPVHPRTAPFGVDGLAVLV